MKCTVKLVQSVFFLPKTTLLQPYGTVNIFGKNQFIKNFEKISVRNQKLTVLNFIFQFNYVMEFNLCEILEAAFR